MSFNTAQWLLAGHLIGLFVWIGGMFAVYWIMRFHTHAPKAVHEKLVLAERSLALMMDIGSALAIGCGVAMIFSPKFTPHLLAMKGQGWFHIKLAVVVLGVLSVHGMLRARIKKFSRGNVSEVPSWQWSVLLASITAIVILVTQGPRWFAKTPPAPPAPSTAPAPGAGVSPAPTPG